MEYRNQEEESVCVPGLSSPWKKLCGIKGYLCVFFSLILFFLPADAVFAQKRHFCTSGRSASMMAAQSSLSLEPR